MSAVSGTALGRRHHRSIDASSRRNALILYGSETGNAQDVAEEISRMVQRLHFETTVLDLDSIQLRDLVRPSVVLFAISTTGQGELPQNARGFWKALLSGALKRDILRRVRFSSFGLGDSSYAQYNVAHRMLHRRLLDLGAVAFCERGEGNEQHPEGHSAGFREWIVLLRQKLSQAFPLPPGVEPIADDVFIEPRWSLQMNEQPLGQQIAALESRGLCREDVHEKHDVGRLKGLPSRALLPVKDTYTAHLEQNQRITSTDHFQDVRLLDFRIEQAIAYGPGAVAVIYPKNYPDDVQTFIELAGWEEIADRQVELVATTATTGDVAVTPSPLRHLHLAKTEVTLRWLLENVLDIMSIPRRSYFAELAHFAGEGSEDEVYQKERLLELANPELIDELWDYTTRPKRTILEVMMDFTTIKIPWQYALSVLPMMRGRQFSIASGGHLRVDQDGRTRVQLLVAIADPPSPIIKWRRRYGVCTRYIASLKEQQQINIGIQEGYLDVQPTELQVPIIMVGPGTGLAPMRSMIYQRVQWAHAPGTAGSGKSLDGDCLFFGCRGENVDHFFRDEWEHFAQTEGLTVQTAFSRDKKQPRQYVQDLIRASGVQISDVLIRRGGKVYVSGSSGAMPSGVRQAILDVVVEHAEMSTVEAEAYLDGMEKNGRYKQETW